MADPLASDTTSRTHQAPWDVLLPRRLLESRLQELDEYSQLQWHLLASRRCAGIVKIEGREKRRPICQHFFERASSQISGGTGVEYECESHPRGIRERGGEARYIRADVCVQEQVHRFFAETAETYGGIDVGVSNAGIHR